jgi:ADP-ribosylglycohydrolase
MNNLSYSQRVEGMLWGMLVADALAMPVHWYYHPGRIVQDYGQITEMQAPKAQHPDSIMSLSNTGGHGRGSQEASVVGDVILRGKKQFWGQRNLHYHHALQRGENTLNLQCLRLLLRHLTQQQRWNPERFLQDYITFMTTEGSHNDTYAESFHRDFFANWAQGKPPLECAGKEDHNTASIGGLILLPALLAFRQGDPDSVLELLRLTHQSATLETFAAVIVRLLHQQLQGEAPLEESAAQACDLLGLKLEPLLEKVAARKISDFDVIGRKISPACYIQHSVPALLYLLQRYPSDAETGLQQNVMVGGDNCHRGAVLGACYGAAYGVAGLPPRWIQQLHQESEIRQEIHDFVQLLG